MQKGDFYFQKYIKHIHDDAFQVNVIIFGDPGLEIESGDYDCPKSLGEAYSHIVSEHL